MCLRTCGRLRQYPRKQQKIVDKLQLALQAHGEELLCSCCHKNFVRKGQNMKCDFHALVKIIALTAVIFLTPRSLAAQTPVSDIFVCSGQNDFVKVDFRVVPNQGMNLNRQIIAEPDNDYSRKIPSSLMFRGARVGPLDFPIVQYTGQTQSQNASFSISFNKSTGKGHLALYYPFPAESYSVTCTNYVPAPEAHTVCRLTCPTQVNRGSDIVIGGKCSYWVVNAKATDDFSFNAHLSASVLMKNMRETVSTSQPSPAPQKIEGSLNGSNQTVRELSLRIKTDSLKTTEEHAFASVNLHGSLANSGWSDSCTVLISNP